MKARLFSSFALVLLLIALSQLGGTSTLAAVSGAEISAHLTSTSFTSAKAGSVKLVYKFSKPSKSFSYLLTRKTASKWQKVRSVKKKGHFEGSKSMTVKKVFAGKSVKIGSYRLKLSADKGSKLLSFNVVKAKVSLFHPHSDFTAGALPVSLKVGDFNGDGIKDLVFANANWMTPFVSVLLGVGDGTFGAETGFRTGSSTAYSVAVGDFNGDNRQDLVTANSGLRNVSVLLGVGNGTFGAAATFGAGNSNVAAAPCWVAVGDFNGDNKQDLVTANGGSNTVSVLLGVGDGTFGAATNFGTGLYPQSVTVGYFNGDNKQDLATANVNSANVSVLLGVGDGTFGAATNFGTGLHPGSVTVGDLNGDNKQDLVAANGGNGISVLLGVGDGTFGAATDYSVAAGPASVVIGDLNGDNKQDIATANSASNDISVLLGIGDGTFGVVTKYSVGTEPTSVAVGDFNGDNKQDLATANQGVGDNPVRKAGTISILLNGG
jgi:hypothetical protein